ncbi:hypothetical protein RhiirA1_457425 [Rhizophagus irregularis]|uniref:Protein kinase domain-containing protein n=1 Tax=Rhizophagus irregularis TaxID=588596 RepID=A0A2N0RYB6_9GLOM|nr:hypothetical protein RhiirA1_457425 [Rhizophagus irregularis]
MRTAHSKKFFSSPDPYIYISGSSSDIYSFGVIMTELSSGNPPFHKRKHVTSLVVLEICNEFGKEVIRKRNLATKAKKLRAMFKEADKEIPNISMLFILVESSHLTIYVDNEETSNE